MPIRDTRMRAMALVQRYQLTSEERRDIVDELLKVMRSDDTKPREKISAAKGLMAAEGQNQGDEHKFAELRIKQRDADLDAIADELGIDAGIIESASSEAEPGDRGTEGAGSDGD